jgi:hypothetical protein
MSYPDLVSHEHLEGVDSGSVVGAEFGHLLANTLVPVGHRHVQATDKDQID